MLALAAYILVFRVNYSELAAAFAGVSWLFIALAVLANFASIMFKVVSWKIIFDFCFKQLHSRWLDLTSALMIGFLVNLLLPARLGELARAFTITRREELRGEKIASMTVLGTVALERLFDGVVMVGIVFLGLSRLELPAWARDGALLIAGALLAVSASSLALLLKSDSIAAAAARRARAGEFNRWERLLARGQGFLARFGAGLGVLRSPGRAAVILLSTAASWMTQLTAVWLTLSAFHLDFVGWSGALLLLILINVAGALPVTPGDVGVFQLAIVIPLTAAYSSLDPSGQCAPANQCITEATALAFALGLQAIEASIGLGLGAGFLLREGVSIRQVRGLGKSEAQTSHSPLP